MTPVIFYRRFCERAISQFNQGTKERTLKDTKLWEKSIVDTVTRLAKGGDVNGLSDLKKMLEVHFDDVLVLNFHNRSEGGVHGSLFCDKRLDFKNTCKALRKMGELPHKNGGINFDYSDLAYAAMKVGMVTIKDDTRMKAVSKAAMTYHEVVLKSTPFKRICAPRADLDKLLEISVRFEEKFFPDHIDDLKAHFETLATTKLCKIDTKTTLKEKSWRKFFKEV